MDHQEKVTGRVKWFNATKGFGFVVTDEVGPDILLHANVLRNFGQGTVTEGAIIEIFTQETPRGIQATEVLSITPPANVPVTEGMRTIDFGDSATIDAPLEPARIKWFDKLRGFGFANVFGYPEDIFVHMETVRQSGFSDLQSGEAFCIRVVEGPRGKMAAEIRNWEAAISEME